jgi:hypothetical protein
MGTVLTVLTACAGFALTVWGARHYFRRRFDRNRHTLAGRAHSLAGRQVGAAMVAVGGFLAVFPDLPWGALADPVAQSAVGGFFSAVFWLLYRLAVVTGLLGLGFSMFLVSERVTRPLGVASRRATDAVVLAMPFGPGRERREIHRQLLGGYDLGGGAASRRTPREWGELLTHEQALTARLLRYQRDPEARYNRPSMADFADPVTATALQAMLDADRLRSPMPPRGTRDVLLTDYGRAVVRLGETLRAAEEHADRLASSGLSAQEHSAVAHAQRTLAFVTGNATSAGERAAAYEQVVTALAEATPAPDAEAERAHPWLDIRDRT